MDVKDKIKSAVVGDGIANKVLGSKGKRIAAGGIVLALVVALAASLMLNMKNTSSFVTLFPGISKEENSEILTVLSSRGVETRRNTEGEVTVPEAQLGDIMLDMSQLGYPKTALPFNIFSDNMGFTTTEFEKRQYLLLSLQDRLERTLKDMNGVKNAIVTLNVANDNSYVWETEDFASTGAVSLTLMPSFELSTDKVTAIQKLVANSVPRMTPENVTIINAETMQEMVGGDMGSVTSYGLSRLDFESKVEARLEDKIKNVLTLAYAPDKIRVSATVVIDYDKMITEDMQYEPEENGSGVVDSFREGQSISGTGAGAGGVAGEELNTDIPGYGTAGTGGPNAADGEYYRDVDYLVGYIKKQIEKDNVKLQKATVAITVNDNNLTEARREQLIEAASKAANIAVEDIVVSGFRQEEELNIADTAKPSIPAQAPALTGIDYRVLLAGAAAAFAIFLILFVLILRSRKKKHMQEDEALFGSIEGDAAEDLLEDLADRASEGAVENKVFVPDEKSDDPVNQVRSFAKMNPEIIASMISSWLKEDRK